MLTITKSKIPNYLTVFRIILVPFLVLSYFWEGEVKYITCLIFAVASFTDYLDGSLSRKWCVTSAFGTFLDPIADKLIVVAALVLLVDANHAYIVPAIGIICREVFISGLREFISGSNVKLPVTFIAKCKTATQMFAITGLLLTSGKSFAIGDNSFLESNEFLFYINGTSVVFLWLSLFMTLQTGYKYFAKVKSEGLL